MKTWRSTLRTTTTGHGHTADLTPDLERCLEEWGDMPYHHDAAWGDGNGYAHVRAALVGPSLAFLVKDGRLLRGTWQQFVLCDFDNRSRDRLVEVQVIGDPGPDTP